MRKSWSNSALSQAQADVAGLANPAADGLREKLDGPVPEGTLLGTEGLVVEVLQSLDEIAIGLMQLMEPVSLDIGDVVGVEERIHLRLGLRSLVARPPVIHHGGEGLAGRTERFFTVAFACLGEKVIDQQGDVVFAFP